MTANSMIKLICIWISLVSVAHAWPGMRRKSEGKTEDYIGPPCTVGTNIEISYAFSTYCTMLL